MAARPATTKLITILASAAVALAVVLAVSYARAPRATRAMVGRPAPSLEVPAAGGQTVRLSDVRGAAVLLVLTDTRWPEAGAYLLEHERLHRKYVQKGLRVLGVALDDPGRDLAGTLDTLGITFTVLHDPGGRAVAAGYGVPAASESYLIGRQGRIEAVYVDRIDSRSPQIRDDIERL